MNDRTIYVKEDGSLSLPPYIDFRSEDDLFIRVRPFVPWYSRWRLYLMGLVPNNGRTDLHARSYEGRKR